MWTSTTFSPLARDISISPRRSRAATSPLGVLCRLPPLTIAAAATPISCSIPDRYGELERYGEQDRYGERDLSGEPVPFGVQARFGEPTHCRASGHYGEPVPFGARIRRPPLSPLQSVE